MRCSLTPPLVFYDPKEKRKERKRKKSVFLAREEIGIGVGERTCKKQLVVHCRIERERGKEGGRKAAPERLFLLNSRSIGFRRAKQLGPDGSEETPEKAVTIRSRKEG